MLSNVSIKKYLEDGDIIIAPWSDDMMDAARVTLHLGSRFLKPKPGIVDIQKGVIPEYEEINLKDDLFFPLEPNMFILGETYESIGLSEKIGMLIDGRSTIARLGLSITQTAMIIDTGQEPKTMTLEIKNSGVNTILLYPKMKFARACFFLLNPAATIRHDSTGKYLAGDVNKPIFKDEFKRTY